MLADPDAVDGNVGAFLPLRAVVAAVVAVVVAVVGGRYDWLSLFCWPVTEAFWTAGRNCCFQRQCFERIDWNSGRHERLEDAAVFAEAAADDAETGPQSPLACLKEYRKEVWP